MKKKPREVLADPPAPSGAPSPETAPTVGSILDELAATAPAADTVMPEGEKPRRGRRKKEEEEAPQPSPFGPFGSMTRKLAEPYYKALDVECPDEVLWVMWGEQAGAVVKYYVPVIDDHPLIAFGLSTFLLVSPILGKIGARYVSQQFVGVGTGHNTGPSPGNVHLRSARDGQEHTRPVTDIRVPPLPGP